MGALSSVVRHCCYLQLVLPGNFQLANFFGCRNKIRLVLWGGGRSFCVVPGICSRCWWMNEIRFGCFECFECSIQRYLQSTHASMYTEFAVFAIAGAIFNNRSEFLPLRLFSIRQTSKSKYPSFGFAWHGWICSQATYVRPMSYWSKHKDKSTHIHYNGSVLRRCCKTDI